MKFNIILLQAYLLKNKKNNKMYNSEIYNEQIKMKLIYFIFDLTSFFLYD